MSWSLVDYEILYDKDEYSIINIKINEINEIEKNGMYFQEKAKDYFRGLYKTYKNSEVLERQLSVDFPRVKCYVNGIEVHSKTDFIKELDGSSYEDKAKMICTQTSVYPVSLRLFEEFKNDEIHVSDFYGKNPLEFKFKFFSKDDMEVNILKKFKIVKILDGNPSTLKILRTSTKINTTSKDVFYTINEE